MERIIMFSHNLKFYREKHKLTQKQLAEKIGYTEKSVSKWENGSGLPTLEMIAKLADLFEVSLDELVYEETSRNYLLGIDGGGTKTVFMLTDESGTVLSTVVKGSSNPNDVGIDGAIALLKDGINEACKGIPYSKVVMFAGISGGGLTGNNVNVLNAFFKKFGFLAFDNGSDIENLMAQVDCERCILSIMGTGFIVYALKGKERKRIAGWGQFFDDGGSGYTLGRDAICAALMASDGSGEKTLITDLLEERIGETAEKHLAKFYREGKSYIAAFADLVFEAAEAGDKVAIKILQKNMEFVAHMINTAAADFPGKEPVPVWFSGGISAKQDVLFPIIEKYLEKDNCELRRLENEPVYGAILRAKEIYENKVGKSLGE